MDNLAKLRPLKLRTEAPLLKMERGKKMQTFRRICLKDHTIQDKCGQTFTVDRGKEYITSPEKNGMVTVFSNYWVPLPVELFGGEIEFTK